MYKVFVQDEPVLFTDSLDGLEEGVDVLTDSENIYGDVYANSGRVNGLAVFDPDGTLWREFQEQHDYIEAAGGVVRNTSDQILLIHRNGLWDLPKGKLEEGESPEIGAIREVEEETGITGLTIGSSLPSTWHTYELRGRRVLKQTYWFAMKSDFDGVLVPQEEEGITEVIWCAKGELSEKAGQTHASLRTLFT